MTEKEAQQLLMEYLYDEMDPKQKKEFEEILEQNESLRNELEELRNTRSLIALAADEPVQAKNSRSGTEDVNQTKHRSFRWAVLSGVAAIFLAAALLVIAYTNVTISSDDGYVSLTLGKSDYIQDSPVTVVEPVTKEDLDLMLDQLRSEQSMLAGLLADELEQRQSEQISEAITLLTSYFEQQRERDLLLITEGFYRMEEETDNRFRERDELVAELIYALANP